jgi:hypothetical protein
LQGDAGSVWQILIGLPIESAQNVGGVQAEMTSQGLPPTQRKRCGRRLSK